MKDHHVSLGAMRRLLVGQAAAAMPQRFLRHLARGCATCWKRAEKLATEPLGPAPPVSEPVALALWRFLQVERLKAAPELPEPEWLAVLGARYRQVVFATRQLPLGFAHLVLEECREAALEDRSRGVPILTEARSVATRSAMAEGRGKELRDLEARAVAYLAVAHCWIQPTLETLAEVLDARITAFTLLAESHRLRRDGTGDIELEATLREITGRLGLSMGFTDDAVELFASAERLLDHPDHLGRRAEAMLQRAVALFAGERRAAGRAAVLAALELEQAMVRQRHQR